MAVFVYADEEIKVIREPEPLIAIVVDFTHQAGKRVDGLVNLVAICTFAEQVSFAARHQRSLVKPVFVSTIASRAFFQVRVEMPESVPAKYALAM